MALGRYSCDNLPLGSGAAEAAGERVPAASGPHF